MSRTELTAEIETLVATLPDEVLADVLSYLRRVREQAEWNNDMSQKLGQIIAEDRELLTRLAR